jgi:two-component system LytT family response regulator
MTSMLELDLDRVVPRAATPLASSRQPLACYLIDADSADRRLLADTIGRAGGATVIGESPGAHALVATVERAQPDVVFLDARTGPDVLDASLADRLGSGRQLVVVSALASDAATAFTAGAADFLLKPYATSRVQLTLSRVRERADRIERLSLLSRDREVETSGAMRGDASAETLAINVDGRVVQLATATIEWIASDGYGAKVFMRDRVIRTRDPLSSVLERLDGGGFVRTHRGAVVNLATARRVEPAGGGGGHLVLGSGQMVPVAKRRMAEVRRAVRERSGRRG